MTLNEIAYLVLDGIEHNHIFDDSDVDIRLVKGWINLKRLQFLKQSTYILNAKDIQSYEFTVENVNSYSGTFSSYPFDNTENQKDNLYKSTEEIPDIVFSKIGMPLVLNIENSDILKPPFLFVPFERLKWAGSGRFNYNMVYSALKGGYIYLQQCDDTFLSSNKSCIINAVFSNPIGINGLTADDEYPCSLDIESIKNAIFDKDFREFMSTKKDIENNSNDDN